MIKKALTLVLTAALSMAGAQTLADTRLSTASVSLEMSGRNMPLSVTLTALARAAGYDVVFLTNVDAPSAGAGANTAQATPPMTYTFENKPFNEVWPLVMDVYGLNYDIVKVGGKDTLRVSNQPLPRVIALRNATATDVEARVKVFYPNLRVASDARTNSLIVSGTNRELADVERIVSEIDRSVAQASTQAPDPSVQRVYTVQGTTEDIVAFLKATYPTLVATPVGRTGQLVVSGPTSVVTAALSLLSQVDRPVPPVAAGPAIVQRVFTLSNAQATEVKEVLEGTLRTQLTTGAAATGTSGAGGTTGAAQGSGSGTAGASGTAGTSGTATAGASGTPGASGVTVIADQRSNTLVVRGTPDQVAQIAELIPVLDVRVPQINVQIRIQEIDERASRSLGLDWSAGIGNFVTRLIGGNLTALFDMTQASAGFNIGATLRALQDQQLSKSIYDGSVTLQSGQRRQGNATSAENASAGAAASVKSGGRVEINIPGSGGSPAIQRQVDYGVLLDFLNPQVSNDGTITLGVRSSISTPQTSLTGATIPNILSFLNREASTTVSLKSGQTVLLGGLLTTSENDTSSGIPFLSSIPVIGNLFKTESTERRRAQLLIVLTGNIIQ